MAWGYVAPMEERYGEVRVLGRHGTNRWGKATYDVLCDCGESTVMCGEDLRRDRSTSCGHKRQARARGLNKLQRQRRAQEVSGREGRLNEWYRQRQELQEALMGEKFVTAAQLSRFCDANLKTIHNWVDKGKITAFRTPGRHLRFNRVVVFQFLSEHGYPIPPVLKDCAPVKDDESESEGTDEQA